MTRYIVEDENGWAKSMRAPRHRPEIKSKLLFSNGPVTVFGSYSAAAAAIKRTLRYATKNNYVASKAWRFRVRKVQERPVDLGFELVD